MDRSWYSLHCLQTTQIRVIRSPSRRSKHADRGVSGGVCVSYITLAGSGSAVQVSHHIICGYLSPLWYQNRDARYPRLLSVSRLCVHPGRPHFPSTPLDDVNNRVALAGRMSLASLLYADSRLQPSGSSPPPHSDVASVVPPSIPPYPPPVTLYAGNTVTSRMARTMVNWLTGLFRCN